MNTLPDIADVRPVDQADLSCLLAIREVLERHGAIGRFGVNLLHDHFPIGADEILLEVCDPDTRTLTIRPGRSSGGDDRFVGTAFQFEPVGGSDAVSAVLVCKVGCFVDLRDRHKRTHDRVWG